MAPLVFAGSSPQTLEQQISTAVWRSWLTSEPDLHRAGSYAGLVRLERHAADQCLGSLIRLAQADGECSDLALLAVLHQLARRARAIACSLRDLDPDIDRIVAVELVRQVLELPAQGRKAYAVRLAHATQDAILRDLQPMRLRGCRDRLVLIDSALPGLEDAAPIRSAVNPVEAASREFRDLLGWARRRRLITPLQIALIDELVEVAIVLDCAGGPKPRTIFSVQVMERVAQRRGMSVRTIQRQRDRALEALRAAAPEYVAA